MKIAKALLELSVLISLAGVVIHLGALAAGVSWFVFFNAPRSVIESYQTGTMFAPVVTLVIAGLMGACAYYAASVREWVPTPPLQRSGLFAMAAVCIARALLLPLLAVTHPELRNGFEIAAAIVWGLAGSGLAAGVVLLSPRIKQQAGSLRHGRAG